MEALASALLDRGHDIVWLHRIDVKPLLHDQRIRFVALGAADFPAGSLQRTWASAARPGGPFGLRRVIRDVAATTDMLCNEAQQRLVEWRVQAVLVDQMEAAGSLLAQAAGLPFVSIACALPVNREPAIPLPVMPWPYAESVAALHRNGVSERIHDWLMRPLARVLQAQCARLGLTAQSTLAECVSPGLQLSQTTEGFDFPRARSAVGLHCGLHHVGPLRPPAAHTRELGLWPLPLAGRPFIFASLGTLQGSRLGLFMRIARASKAVGAQLLVAHCGGLDVRGVQALERAGATWVTDFAPQREVLARADLLITHAGLNTVMDALAAGVPMVALPIAFDQPGVAARVVQAGVGLRLAPGRSSARDIERAIRTVLGDPSFRHRAAALGEEVRQAPGTQGAADLIEQNVRPLHTTKDARELVVA